MPGGSRQNTDGGKAWSAPPGKHHNLQTQWTVTDHVGAPSSCPHTADPPRRTEIGGQWSQPVLAADWPG